jgi:hypothetical protein
MRDSTELRRLGGKHWYAGLLDAGLIFATDVGRNTVGIGSFAVRVTILFQGPSGTVALIVACRDVPRVETAVVCKAFLILSGLPAMQPAALTENADKALNAPSKPC